MTPDNIALAESIASVLFKSLITVLVVVGSVLALGWGVLALGLFLRDLLGITDLERRVAALELAAQPKEK